MRPIEWFHNPKQELLNLENFCASVQYRMKVWWVLGQLNICQSDFSVLMTNNCGVSFFYMCNVWLLFACCYFEHLALFWLMNCCCRLCALPCSSTTYWKLWLLFSLVLRWVFTYQFFAIFVSGSSVTLHISRFIVSKHLWAVVIKVSLPGPLKDVSLSNYICKSW